MTPRWKVHMRETVRQRTLLENLLCRGVDDWVDDATVFGNIASRVAHTPEDRRLVAVGLLALAVLQGLVVSGDLAQDEGFEPWDVPAEAAARRIVDTWMAASEPSIAPGDVCWLRSTGRGDAIGTSVLAEGP